MDKKHLDKVWQRGDYFLGFGFGSGLLPIAPGTWGTLAAIPLYFLIKDFNPYLYCLIVVIAFIGGCRICETICNESGVHDYSGIVWDEVVGFMITLFLVPPGAIWIVVGFLLFRFFDVIKPWPIKQVDAKVSGGFGVMFDDVLAGVYAWICLQLFSYGVSIL